MDKVQYVFNDCTKFDNSIIITQYIEMELLVCLPDPEYELGEFYGAGVEELNAKRVKIDQLLIEMKKNV